MIPSDLGSILGGGAIAAIATSLVTCWHPLRGMDDSGATKLAIVVTVLWAGLIGAMAILKHESTHTLAYDLGIFDQDLVRS